MVPSVTIRTDDQASLEQRISFIVRTLPPVTLLNFGLVAWFADDPWPIVGLAAAFVLNIFVVSRLLTRSRPGFAVSAVMVNLALFGAAALLGGAQSPGWILFMVSIVAAVINVLGLRVRLGLLALANVVCLATNLIVGRPAAITAAVTLLMLGISVLLFRITQHLEMQQAVIEEERARSDALLGLLMPDRIADRIKGGETQVADRFDPVTVLFADIVGFTPMAQELAPEQLVDVLDRLFTVFDACIDDHGLEKIKTIGDAYMVASGLDGAPDRPEMVVRFAFAMQRELTRFNGSEGTDFALRIGINRGPVVAGVVGVRRFTYDVWGDTVNTAARMESHGLPGEVQVTRAIMESVTDTVSSRPRGIIDIKGKGPMEVWLLRPLDGP